MADRSVRQARKTKELQRIICKEQQKVKIKEVQRILKKQVWERTEEEIKILHSFPEIVCIVQERLKRLCNLKARLKEIFDPPDVLTEKCNQLAKALKEIKNVVIYSGAGISTAACIPDYRGPEGIWTLLQKGKHIKFQDLSFAEPTFTHMAICQMHKNGIVSHVVSQNCDGLHLRSGFPRNALSEVHGNMYIEVCPKCKPLRQFIRLFDVTEHTGLHRHRTGRFCYKCGVELNDTIVHFGERGLLHWPLNWKGAAKAVAKAGAILCLGSSLKVLKRYQCLWATSRPFNKRPKLYIVNLQWTPKDLHCTLKIHGKCDDVMKQVMSILRIEVPQYQRKQDPVFQLAIPLTSEEICSTSRTSLVPPQEILNLECVRKKRCCKSEASIIDEEHSYAKSSSYDSKEHCFQVIEAVHTGSNKEQPLDAFPKSRINETYSSEALHMSENNIPGNDARDCLVGKVTENTLCGWYGKGCAKLKKTKRRR